MDAEVVDAYIDPERCCNQGSIVKLQNGDLLLGYNEERGPMHADTGRSCLIKSSDGGRSWDPSTRVVVEDYTDHTGNWDCAFAQISDGTIIMHTRICGFINAPGAIANRIDEQAMGYVRPHQTGYAVYKSSDNGDTWNGPIPVSTYPIADSGTAVCLAGGTGSGHVVELPDGGLLMPLEGTLSPDGYILGGGVNWEPSRCFLLRSDDGGDTWHHWGTMAFDPASIFIFQEPSLTRM
ncbi:MAG: exo-alpha-sialidase, partial [Acidimicrobiaceae bacterium]|nr:exo-alpha-sialidase [Acidimicrobiaceae bacterium]